MHYGWVATLAVVLQWNFQSGELRTSTGVKRCGRRSIRPLKMQVSYEAISTAAWQRFLSVATGWL
jgi:hypothetical protein